MEQIEEMMFLGAAIFVVCLALSCLFTEQKIVQKLNETVYRNFHQESIIEEVWYE